MKWREHEGGVRWLEAELPGARAAFSTRLGGVSEPPFDTLNLGILTGDEGVPENRRRLATALDLDPERVLIGHQVHASAVARHRAPMEPPSFADGTPAPEADGHATDVPGLAPLVFVADCLPVALAGPRGVAMLHCGWRGLASGIVARGVREVRGTAAAIGPGIGPCCYEVGEEVARAFEPLGDGVRQGRTLDLVEVARRLLADAGVAEVESSGLCTSCEAHLFFSHRRDGGVTGRQAGVVWMEA
jgi:polyphenol oxidase